MFVVTCVTMSVAPSFAQDQPPDGDLPQPADIRPLSPAVAAVLASNPTTPSALLRSVVLLDRLGASRQARPLLSKLLETNLNEARMADLCHQVESDALLRLAGAEPLAPEAGQLVSALLAAASKRARNPQRLATLVGQLGDPLPAVRRAALVDLLQAKTDAVDALLNALADPGRRDAHPAIQRALVEMGPLAVDPLLAALQTTDAVLKVRLMGVCGALGSHAARLLPLLVGPALGSTHPDVRAAARAALARLHHQLPSKPEAERLLQMHVHRYLEGTGALVRDHQDQVLVWHWSDTDKRVVPHRYAEQDAAMVLARRLAADLVALDPQRETYQRLDLACRLEADKVRHGLAAPLPRGRESGFQRALELGPRAVEDVLAFALTGQHIGAALGAIEMLDQIGAGDLVRGHGGQRSPLVRAAAYGDRRVCFAAINTTLKLDPAQPYPGSSAVPEALGFFVSTEGVRRALVVAPRPEDGQRLASMLIALGYDAEPAADGHRLLKMAASSADVELVLIRMTVDRPPVRELLYRLRRDWRTAHLPVGLIASSNNWQRGQSIASADPSTGVFARPDDGAAMEAVVARLTGIAGRSLVPVDERRAQAIAALQWLGKLARSPRRTYDVRAQMPFVQRALLAEPLQSHAAPVLTAAGLSSSQKALVDLASHGSFALTERELAAAAFRTSVARHGILLTGREIQHQYDRYNASAHADRSTQQLLSSILDTLESKNQVPE